MEKLMTLYTTGTGGEKTFGLMPLSNNCPFNEAIYMPKLEALAVLGRSTRDTFTMVERLDENGEASVTQVKTKDGYRQLQRQQRMQVKTPWEYFINEKEEIRTFVNTHANNADTFDFEKYLSKIDIEIVSSL